MVDQAASLDAVFQALADPTRRRIVELLAREGPQAVSELARPFRMSLQAISKHIGVLAGAGLVRRTKRGRQQVCALEERPMSEAIDWMQEYQAFWRSNLKELARYLEDRSND